MSSSQAVELSMAGTGLIRRPIHVQIGFLTLVGLLLWVISLLQLSRTGLLVDSTGILRGLPASYWTALVVLTVVSSLAWQLDRRYQLLVGIQLCFFVVAFWLTPLFLGNTLSGTRYSFGYHTLTQYIQTYGHLDPQSQWYHYWPAFNLVDATVLEVIGPGYAESLLVWAVAPMQLLVALLLAALFNKRLPGNHWAMAAWFYVLFNWTGQTYFSPQGLANILMITLVLLVFSVGFRMERTQPNFLLATILVIGGLTITHMLTSFVAAFLLASVEIGRRRLPVLGAVAAVIFTAWLLYLATAYFDSQIPLFMRRLLRFDELWFWNVARAQKLGSGSHISVVSVRMWYTVAAGLIALWGLAFSRKHRDSADGTFLAMGAGIVAILPLQVYQNELLSRLFLYISPVLAYFSAKLLRNRTTQVVLTLVLVGALPFAVVSLHGNQMVDRVSVGQRAYWRFLEHKTDRGNLGLGGIPMTWTFGRAGRYVSGFDWIAGYGTKWQERLEERGWVEWGIPNYLGFTGYEDAGFRLWTDLPDAVRELTDQANRITYYQFIYSSGEVIGYYDEGVKPP